MRSMRIVPGATPLRLFVHMTDCMNKVQNESYEMSSLFVTMPPRICDKFQKCDQDYLVF